MTILYLLDAAVAVTPTDKLLYYGPLGTYAALATYGVIKLYGDLRASDAARVKEAQEMQKVVFDGITKLGDITEKLTDMAQRRRS